MIQNAAVNWNPYVEALGKLEEGQKAQENLEQQHLRGSVNRGGLSCCHELNEEQLGKETSGGVVLSNGKGQTKTSL